MSTHLVFTGCDDTVKSRVETYWDKKLRRLERLLVPYRADLQDIRLTVHFHQSNAHKERYEVRAAIHLPTGTLAAEANDPDVHVALDRVADTLAGEVKRHKERVRKEHLFQRKRQTRAIASAAQVAAGL